MRSYQQYCSVARALDLIGDRWTLLIVRELTLRPCRYTDLRAGLPGIATNLLAERLRNLADAGVVAVEQAPPPVATTLYSLTSWGAELRPMLVTLGHWGARLMASGAGESHFRSHWAAIAASGVYAGVDLAGLEPLTIRITGQGGAPATIRAAPDGLHITAQSDHDGGAESYLELATDPDTTIALLTGSLYPDDIRAPQRALIHGDDEALRRFVALIDRAPGRG